MRVLPNLNKSNQTETRYFIYEISSGIPEERLINNTVGATHTVHTHRRGYIKRDWVHKFNTSFGENATVMPSPDKEYFALPKELLKLDGIIVISFSDKDIMDLWARTLFALKEPVHILKFLRPEGWTWAPYDPLQEAREKELLEIEEIKKKNDIRTAKKKSEDIDKEVKKKEKKEDYSLF